MSILLVEDEPSLLEVITMFLEDAGLHVCQAGNAQEALKLLHDPDHSFSVMVTDVGLGMGDNGLELAAKAKQHRRELFVVYETGSPAQLQGRPLADWETLFEKPYDVCKLADVVFRLDRLARQQHGGRCVASMGSPPELLAAPLH
ncbi:MAG: response regulator [Acetobacteraceae bacterium]|nr:MAG: response regulator [Acetobacteraceae bacterium]